MFTFLSSLSPFCFLNPCSFSLFFLFSFYICFILLSFIDYLLFTKAKWMFYSWLHLLASYLLICSFGSIMFYLDSCRIFHEPAKLWTDIKRKDMEKDLQSERKQSQLCLYHKNHLFMCTHLHYGGMVE